MLIPNQHVESNTLLIKAEPGHKPNLYDKSNHKKKEAIIKGSFL